MTELSNEDLISLKKRFRCFFRGSECERILQANQWVCKGIMKVFGAWVVQITFVTTALALQGNNGAISACQHGLSDQATKLVQNLYSSLAADAEQVEVCDRALVETETTASRVGFGRRHRYVVVFARLDFTSAVCRSRRIADRCAAKGSPSGHEVLYRLPK
jgi:hypothetical protein